MLGYIYSIVSTKTGMIYIGSTTKNKVEDRWNEHKNDMLSNRHNNWKLRFLIVHQGIDDLIFKMELKGCFPTYQDLLKIEGIWIRSVCEEFCLNIDRWPELGRGFYGKEHKSESKKLISIGNSGENNGNYNKKGEKSHLWGWKHDKETLTNLRKIRLGNLNPMWGKSNCLKEYLFKSPDSKIYFIINMLRFCNDYSLDNSHMTSVATGKRKQHKGWVGGYAPQWVIDKVLSLMKPGQYWVEVDLEGNIL